MQADQRVIYEEVLAAQRVVMEHGYHGLVIVPVHQHYSSSTMHSVKYMWNFVCMILPHFQYSELSTGATYLIKNFR